MNISEMRLTKEQQDKIADIKREWIAELERLDRELPPSDPKMLDGPRTWEVVKLEKKYKKMIREIIEEKQ